MKNLSLKLKIIIAGSLPLLCFLTMVGIGTFRDYNAFDEATRIEKKFLVIDSSSKLVHELQKERGLTASFLNGGAPFQSLEAQRTLVEKNLVLLKETVPKSGFSAEVIKQINQAINSIETIRSSIDSKKLSTDKAIKSYTEIINSLLSLQTLVASTTNFSQLATGLKAFRILEGGKESGGKLRANMSAIFSKNAPISQSKLTAVINLKAGLDQALISYGLVLDDKSKGLLVELKKSRDWSEVQKEFYSLLDNSKMGDYGVDSKQFFATITRSLNIVGSVILHEKSLLKDQIAEIKSNSFESLWQVFGGSALLSCFVIFLLIKISGGASKSIIDISNVLKEQSEQVSNSSIKMESVSSQLSEASIKQASSLQETVSSIDEISSMIERNSDAANTSTEISRKSNDTAKRGKERIVQMISSIDEISSSNDKIMVEMEANNTEITRIVQLISEIGEKTKVINDIVFQTKLLSFNASVEAARAGEHGKGFAVVAEEVGNLAAMSGKAALEITDMLDDSIKQVSNIVEKSKEKISRLIHNGKEKVESGRVVAIECDDALEEILQNVSSVNEMVTEISTASSEQSAGVREVTKAMQQLDQVAHQNTSAANDSAATAAHLKDQARKLNDAVRALNISINGDGGVEKHLETVEDHLSVVEENDSHFKD